MNANRRALHQAINSHGMKKGFLQLLRRYVRRKALPPYLRGLNAVAFTITGLRTRGGTPDNVAHLTLACRTRSVAYPLFYPDPITPFHPDPLLLPLPCNGFSSTAFQHQRESPRMLDNKAPRCTHSLPLLRNADGATMASLLQCELFHKQPLTYIDHRWRGTALRWGVNQCTTS